MKRSRLLNLLLSGLIGVMTALPPSTSVADDTEIYLGASAGGDNAIRPNVLFVLDTSGSMSGNVDSNGDRLDHMKDAFFQIMDSVNNINVGLMRFTDPGGPILWPVSFVDEDADVIEGGGSVGFPVNVRVSNANDDSEEVILTGNITLDSDELNFINTDGGIATVTIDQSDNTGMRVLAQTDNAEELGDDIITLNRIDMDSAQTNAVRFSSVPVPVGAVVTDARVIFTARDNNSGSPTYVIRGESNANPAAFPTSCNGCADVTNRTTTATSVTWSPPDWSGNDKGADTTTPNLATIVNSIITLGGWAPGNAMVFIIDPSTTGGVRSANTFQGAGGDTSRVAELQITYQLAAAAPPLPQITGMRFPEVPIPQGATITNAFLEFYPSTLSTTDIDVDIAAEASDDAAPFTATSGDLSGRLRTPVVNWKETDDWDVDLSVPPDGIGDEPQQTVDISAVVQAVVNRPGWCGNNAMAFFVQQSAAAVNGPLKALSFDADQSRAPILRIDYDDSSVKPGACINTTLTSQVFASANDAEETIDTGSISLGGSQFDMRSVQINALRFTQLNISQGATVLEASLVFTARAVDTGATTLKFEAEAIDDSPAITSTVKDISDRTTTAASVNWAAPDFDTTGGIYETVDISPIIQEVVNRPDWKPFNAMTIIQSHVSGGQRRARTFNHDAVDAPILKIKVQGAGSTATFTVRSKLKNVVDNLDHEGFTPIIDTLYEAAKYYRGEDVLWGAQRGFDNSSSHFSCDDPPHLCNDTGSNNSVRNNTRISHPASFEGGSVVTPAGCTEGNLNNSDCRERKVTGTPEYISPIEEGCQANYIVLLTDGQANHNDSAPLIEADYGLNCAGGATGNETCGVELADFLANNDQSSLAGDQNVFTYTIGFNFSSSFLDNLAEAGGGEFYTADNSAQLAAVFQLIIADILNRSTSFATPSLSVNAFNKLFDLNDVYFSLFIPDSRLAWKGNVKKYQICDDSAVCELGEILDASGDEAINPADQRIRDTALSFWSSGIDGAEIEVGGAAENVPTYTARTVYTYADLTDPAVNPLNVTLDADGSRHIVEDANDDGILDGIDGHASHPDPLADTQFLLGDDTAILSAVERAELIDWIQGRDVDDEDEDGSDTDDRFTFNDPLHSSPIAITFGGTEADPVIKLFVGTNEGGLRMINAFNGVEEWIFYPQDMLRQQLRLKNNTNGNHLYGLDTVPAVWIFDENEDGIIKDNDFVRLIIGQRRGGLNYYAVDVTPDSELSDPAALGGVVPELLWRIDGGEAEFPNLGQTWSRPVLTRMRFGTDTAGESTTKTLIAFGGGYDTVQDNGFFGNSTPGNAIYIADAETGELVYTISADDPGVGDFLEVPDMTCPIPSDLAMFDSDGDGAEDRIYVGDLCGQVWRVDLLPNLSTDEGVKAIVGKFAEVSELDPDPTFIEDHRKIFYRPDIVQVLNDEFSTVARYDLVVVVTGRRDNPLNLDVQDRVYALRDFHVDQLTDSDDDGLADAGTYTTILGPTQNQAGTLFDSTQVVEDPTGSDLSDFQVSDGWYLDFQDEGEKSLAAPVILSGKLFVTTYLPEGVVDASSCALAEGSGRLFGLDVLTGGVVFNYDDADGTDTLTASDKIFTLGAGIPSSAVPIFQEEGITLLIGGGGGATVVDPDIELPRGRTYWYQQ